MTIRFIRRTDFQPRHHRYKKKETPQGTAVRKNLELSCECVLSQ